MTATAQIALFPLKVVIFPGGRLDLQIFEQRYLDLVSASLRESRGFGICLLREGEEVLTAGASQTVHRSGTLVEIQDWDQLDNGLLGIKVEGQRKFRVEDCWLAESGVLQATVSYVDWDDVRAPPVPVEEEHEGLAELLQNLANHPMVRQLGLQIDYQNLRSLGWRLGELLPIAAEQRQELLEMDSPEARIEAIQALVAGLANAGQA